METKQTLRPRAAAHQAPGTCVSVCVQGRGSAVQHSGSPTLHPQGAGGP